MESLIDFIKNFVAENNEDFEKWRAEKDKRNEIENVG
nr:MAG TPA: hypothetical protein [Caudoviricetes sp.]